MGLRLRVKYFDASNNELEPKVVEGAYSDEWKRLSTLGHPGTARPLGVEQLADLHNSIDWGGVEPVNGIRSLALTEKINADTIAAGEITAGTVNYYFPDPYAWHDCQFSLLEGKVVQGQYGMSSYISADTVHLNVPTGPADQSPLDAGNYVYSSLPDYIVSLKYSSVMKSYYLLCFKGSASAGSVPPEIYIKEIPIPADSSFYEEISKFYGYGESNPLYGVFDPQNYVSQGWTAVEDPQVAQYFVSPQYVALPESNDGLLLVNSQGQYIDEAVIWDPLSGDITQLVIDESLRQQLYWSQAAQGYCGLPANYTNLQSGTAKMFVVAEGTLTMFYTALYVGDELFYTTSGDSMDNAGKPLNNSNIRSIAVYYNGGSDSFNLPTLAAIGTPTFLSIGDGFYIGSNQFSPFKQISQSGMVGGVTTYESGYTILHAPLTYGTDFYLGGVIVETAIEPPTGAVKMQEFIELY